MLDIYVLIFQNSAIMSKTAVHATLYDKAKRTNSYKC